MGELLLMPKCVNCIHRVRVRGRAFCAPCSAEVDEHIAEHSARKRERCPGCGERVQSSVIADGLEIETWHYSCLMSSGVGR